MELGQYNRARVEEIAPQGYYLELETGGRVLLPGNREKFQLEQGEILDVFVYADSEDRPIATLDKPYATVGEFAVLEVKEVNRFGAFLDWGLTKDLFLPFKQQLGELQRGDRCVVYILLDDKSNRIVATEKIRAFVDKNVRYLHVGQKVELVAQDITQEYIDCLVDYRYMGRLKKSPDVGEIYIADKFDGFIQNISEGGKIALSLTPVGYKGLLKSGEDQIILEKIKAAGGSLPYGDRTDPEIMRKEFGMSKKSFKKLLGTLFREGKIKITDKGISL